MSKDITPTSPRRRWFQFSLATLFVIVTMAALHVTAAKELGLSGIASVWIATCGVGIMWWSTSIERFSMFLLGVVILLFAFLVGAGLFEPTHL